LGDRDGGQYVREGVPDEISKHLIPKANLTTPNHFELETLTGTSIRTLGEALAAAGRLREAGPEVVVCTSLERTETPPGQVETLLVGPEGAWLGRHNAVTQAPHGTGDMLAALLLGHWLRGEPPERALAAALSAVWSVVQASTDPPDQELALVSAQAQITAPSHTVQVEKVWPGGLKPPF
jgi:pyridoxine kinase